MTDLDQPQRLQEHNIQCVPVCKHKEVIGLVDIIDIVSFLLCEDPRSNLVEASVKLKLFPSCLGNDSAGLPEQPETKHFMTDSNISSISTWKDILKGQTARNLISTISILRKCLPSQTTVVLTL